MPPTMPNCHQTLCRHTYYNYGSYLRSRGYDKEICNLVMELQNGKIPIKQILADQPNGGVLTIDGDLQVTGTISGNLPQYPGLPPPVLANVYQNNPGGNGILFTTSALRYKSNIANIDLSKARKLLDISAKSFQYNENPGITHIGVIAEDLDAADLKEFVKYDDQGRPDAVYYQNLVAPLIELVKDLNARISNLEIAYKLLLEKHEE